MIRIKNENMNGHNGLNGLNGHNGHVAFQAQPFLAPTSQQFPPAVNNYPPKKLRRISRACDFCHKRSIRCKPCEEVRGSCQNCFDFGVDCTYLRPAKKRGIKSGNSKEVKAPSENGTIGTSSRDGESDARMLLELTNASQTNGYQMVIANETKIQNLVDVYFEVVYSIFPLFHTPSLKKRVENRDYLTDQSFFADTMAICALASARVRDGALCPGRWEPSHFQDPPPESFFAAVKEIMPQDLGAMRGLDWMRTCALLALYGIQVGRIDIMHQYLGLYHSLVSMDSLHDEKNWPKDIGIVEVQLRRRLFWSMYSLEVCCSITWGSIVRCREEQSHVAYPSEVDDEFFTDAGYDDHGRLVSSPPATTNPVCWLHGLNFGTQLYRILEHAMDDLRRQRPDSNRFPAADLFNREVPKPSAVLEKVMTMYEGLPPRFKEAILPPTNGAGGLEDKFSFQAANITATLQLVRMVLFTSEDATVDQKCAIAQDLLQSFNNIPTVFLRAISSPLLHHLSGIGAILGSAIQGPISESSYLQVRGVLLQMADLLSGLETNITRAVGAASRLRTQIANIDAYMNTQRQNEHPHPHPQLLLNNYQPVVSNPNIDPSLQDAFQAAIHYSNGGTESMTATLNGVGEHNLQLPPELLGNWPWSSDFSQGFSGAGAGNGGQF